MATPLLIFSDSPSGPSGLSRIARDLAVRLAEEPEFRVGAVGHNGLGSRHFKFTEYHCTYSPDMEPVDLPRIWEDFAGSEHGIFFAIEDITRMLQFYLPAYASSSSLREFYSRKPFRSWLYCPIDATGPQDKLTQSSRDTLLRCDRILAYTDWAAGVVERTIGTRPPHLPHLIVTGKL